MTAQTFPFIPMLFECALMLRAILSTTLAYIVYKLQIPTATILVPYELFGSKINCQIYNLKLPGADISRKVCA